MTPTDEINEKNLKSYLDNFTNNYMSMDQTEELFKQNGFKHIKTLDRMFNSFNSHNSRCIFISSCNKSNNVGIFLEFIFIHFI